MIFGLLWAAACIKDNRQQAIRLVNIILGCSILNTLAGIQEYALEREQNSRDLLTRQYHSAIKVLISVGIFISLKKLL